MRRSPLAQWKQILALSAAAFLLAPVGQALAGCGCDHPPPGYAPVMPAFGSPGKHIRVNAPSGSEFLVGAPYLVRIGGADVAVAAESTSHLKLQVPADAQPGPTEVEIVGPDTTLKYEKADFTVLSAAPVVPEQNGLFVVQDFEASVSEDGTLLVPFNLTEVAAETQFLVVLRGLPLSFEQDEVVFHNADGVDLTLFTLAVDDATERQWGSYHGWDVEQDRGFTRTVFRRKIMKALLGDLSDKLTYWRHEFHTYKSAHQAGGTHEVDETGYHKNDGTLHIDHDHLVLTVSGKLRGNEGTDRSTWQDLSPGSETVDVFVLTLQSPVPLEPEMMAGQLTGSMLVNAFSDMNLEGWGSYDRDHDDD